MDYFLFNFSGVQFHYTMSLQKKPVLKLLSFSKQFQGQAVNTYTCGTTLFRRYRDALSQSAITLLTLNAGVTLPNTLAEAI